MLGSGEALPRSASSHLPSDGFSPRRRGAAEAPGAELSLCYQKVSGGVAGRHSCLEAGQEHVAGRGTASQKDLLPFSGCCPQFPSLQRVF